MAKVHISNVTVLDNPSSFLNPFQFEITFECTEDLATDLEWKIIYVGSAESVEHDQILETVLVGPVPAGCHKFVFEAPAPDINKIPINDVVGVTVVLLTCSYRSKEFIRVGYYVNNFYRSEDVELNENPPAIPIYEQLQRTIVTKDVRVTKFKIDWDDEVQADTNNAENVPPVGNPENAANQERDREPMKPANFSNESNSVGVAMDTS
ncbi:histone chaperone asf1-like [Haliotis asinina]|uniref:histone chaperone asf1-like n=1 Tax=Haliotis rufescens TaxID=6454 RepID=UPI001EB05A5C|nr:histone chaperone asf1-like [Haliotis rufescens]